MKKKHFTSITIIAVYAAFFAACSKDNSEEIDPVSGEQKSTNINQETVAPANGSLVFQSRFEIGKDPANPSNPNPNPTRIINPESQQPLIIGNEGYGTSSTDWEYNLEKKTPNKWNKFQLNYEQGSENQRFAKIIEDPSKPNNRVMHFQINSANVFIPFPQSGSQYPDGQHKGRVSSEIFSNPTVASGVSEYYQKIKVYIPNDFSALKASNRPAASDWLLLHEFRDGIPLPNGTSDQKKEFRVMVNLDKQSNVNNQNTDLYFKVIGEQSLNGWKPVWEKLDTTFPVPLGSWIETEIYIKEGKGTAGRVYFAARVVNAKNDAPWKVLCDVNKPTVHTDNENPSGYTSWCPMKLYCSKEIVEVFNNASKKLYVYWDDLEIYEGRKP